MSKEYAQVEYSSDEEEIKKKKKKKPKIPPAPRKITPMPNPDKKKHESYKKSHNPIRFPKPFRCCVLGKVNSGKSLIAKHILMAHQEKKPKFDEVHIIHGCAETHTTEYDDIEPTSVRDKIPSYDEFDPEPRKLLIFDDVDFTIMPGKELRNLSELFRFGSTHCNISILLLHQSWFRIPKIAKDCSNVFVIFRPHDNDELATIGRRVGLKKDKIFQIFKDHMPGWRDSLLINLCPGAKHKYSKNLFQPLAEIDSDSESD
jgi:hypothetical protein